MSKIIRDITYIARCGSQYRNQHLEPLGLTGRQAGSLIAICNHPGISQEQLGRRVVLNKSNITRQLTLLEEQGFVERRPSPTDKRVMQLYPTEKTQQLLPQIRQVYRNWREYLLDGMTEAEQEMLEQLLSRIKDRAGQWLEVHRFD